MSRSVPSPARVRRVLVAMLGLAGALAAASPAAAASSDLAYQCVFPVVGTHTVSLSVSSDYPVSAPGDTLVSMNRVRFEAADTGGALAGLGAVRISGRADLASWASRHGVGSVFADLSDWETGGSGPIVLKGEGQGVGFYASWDEPTSVATGDLKLTLKAQKSDGSYVMLPTVAAWADSDPTTIEISCAPPAGEDTTFATIANEQGCWVDESCAAPAVPAEVSLSPVYATRAFLKWKKVEDPSLAGYFVKLDGEDEERNVGTTGFFELAGLTAGTSYTGTIRARSKDATVADSAPVAISFTTQLAGPPSAPQLTVAATSNSVTLSWPVPSSPSPITGYEISNIELEGPWAGESRTVFATATTVTWPDLPSNRRHLFEVVAKNAAGESASTRVYVTTKPDCDCVLAPPTGLRAENVSATTVGLGWTAPANADTLGVRRYEVYRGSTRVADTTGTYVVAQGLTPSTEYTFTVRAVGIDGQISADSAPLKVTTLAKVPPASTTVAYKVTGSATVKTLIRGTLPIKGSSTLTYTPKGDFREVEGTLDLGQSTGRLVALGFLPVTAKVGFVSSGRATGMQGGFIPSMNLSQQVRIKVLEAKLFGAIPLAGGNNCQSKQLTTIGLSAPAFLPAGGGTLTGTFKISDLNGCGAFNGIVSPITAGDGNTLSVNLAPAVSPSG